MTYLATSRNRYGGVKRSCNGMVWAALVLIALSSGCQKPSRPETPGQSTPFAAPADSNQTNLADAKARSLNLVIPEAGQWQANQSGSTELPVARRSTNPRKTTRVLEPSIHWGRMVHIVKPGETLSSISKRYYETESYWRIIFNENHSRLSSPSVLPAGERLYLPTNPRQDRASVVIVPGNRPDFYIVGPGDTLFKIADLFLGDGHQWQQIYEANGYQLRSPQDLQEGLCLVIP